MSESAGNSIQLDTLSLDQLQQLRQQEEARLQGLTQRYATLRAAAARLNASTRAVVEMEQAAPDSQVLVPLTESLYVPGKLQPHKPLLVELGTGFFCEKNAADCKSFIDRKAQLVQQNSEHLTQAIQATQANAQAIQSAMQSKFLEIRARREGQRHREAVEGK